MKKLIAMFAVGAVVLSGVAMATSAAQVTDEAYVQAKIDARLHDLLVKARIDRQAP